MAHAQAGLDHRGRRSSSAPFSRSEDWSHAVTPIVDGLATPFWDFYQGMTGGAGSLPRGGESFVILRDATVRPGLVRALEREGLEPHSQRWEETWGCPPSFGPPKMAGSAGTPYAGHTKREGRTPPSRLF